MKADNQRTGWSPFVPDELSGFEKSELSLPPADDGALAATLVRSVTSGSASRGAVLYVHGFSDYFFHSHLSAVFEKAGFRFYGLDLRRYGRSLRLHNRPGSATELSDYFVELDRAIERLEAQHQAVSSIIAHSTGGLIVSLYLAARPKSAVRSLVLSSPFFAFSLNKLETALSIMVAGVGRVFPNLLVPLTMNSTYGKTLHRDHGGEWNYDLKKKPLHGFRLYSGWFQMIRKGQAQIRAGLALHVPILCLYSDRSRRPGAEPSSADRNADLVLDVADMRALSPGLGKAVTLVEIPGGMHDLTLSPAPARDLAIAEMIQFISAHSG